MIDLERARPVRSHRRGPRTLSQRAGYRECPNPRPGRGACLLASPLRKGRLCAEIMITATADALYLDAEAALARAAAGSGSNATSSPTMSRSKMSPTDIRLFHFIRKPPANLRRSNRAAVAPRAPFWPGRLGLSLDGQTHRVWLGDRGHVADLIADPRRDPPDRSRRPALGLRA